MKRSIAALLALGLSACAVNLGGPADIPVPTVAVAADAGTSAAAIAAVITDADARAALVIAPADAEWYAELATATGLELSRPGELDGSSAAFLVEREALGDTTVTLEYDGDRLRVHDALYAIEENRLLDLLAFRLEAGDDVAGALGAFLEYVATDVSNRAAVAIAVTVPDAETGDRVARLLSPGFFDALRCEPGLSPAADRAGVRLFYGPEARIYCESASTGDPAGADLVRADLIMGRR